MKRLRQYSACALSILLVTIVVSVSGLQAQDKIATTAAQFLGISVGARAIGMGSAFVASPSDVTALYWNPGAFQMAGKSEFVFSNTDWLAGTKFRWFGFMYNLGDENAFGVSMTQLDYGEDEVNTVSQPDGTGERWSAQDLALAVSYSRRLTDRFAMGGSAKYIQQRIWNESASTFAFDLGLLYVTGFNDMRLGVSMSNFGGDMKLEGTDLNNRVDIDPSNAGSNKTLVASLKTDPWPLPLFFRVGAAMDVMKAEQFRLTVAADALRPVDNRESVNIGGELGWNEMFFVRGGYKSIFGTDQEEGLSLGAGFNYKAQGMGEIAMDYAYTKFGSFGNVNTITLGIGF
jgi:hypothetical protein